MWVGTAAFSARLALGLHVGSFLSPVFVGVSDFGGGRSGTSVGFVFGSSRLRVCFLPKTLNSALPSFSIPLTHPSIMAGVAAISTASAISPKIGIKSSTSSSGASRAGTATRQKAFAATSRAACSAAASAAAFAASLRSFARLDANSHGQISHAVIRVRYGTGSRYKFRAKSVQSLNTEMRLRSMTYSWGGSCHSRNSVDHHGSSCRPFYCRGSSCW